MKQRKFIITMSPAKKFSLEIPKFEFSTSRPHFLDQADQLALQLKKLNMSELKGLMNISESIAKLNFDRYQSFQQHCEGGHPCGFLFAGDAFKSLELASLSHPQLRRFVHFKSPYLNFYKLFWLKF